jgi:hypothetical protein
LLKQACNSVVTLAKFLAFNFQKFCFNSLLIPWWLRIPATENMIFKKFVDCVVKEVLNSKYFPAPRFVPSFCTEAPFDQIKTNNKFCKKNLKIQKHQSASDEGENQKRIVMSSF